VREEVEENDTAYGDMIRGLARAQAATVQVLALPRSGQLNRGVGVVVGEDAQVWFILTNNHVLEDAPEVGIAASVTQQDQIRWQGASDTILATDPVADLALLRIARRDDAAFTLKPIIFSDAQRANMLELSEIRISTITRPARITTSALFSRRATQKMFLSALARERDGKLIIHGESFKWGMSGSPVIDSQGTLLGLMDISYAPEGQTIGGGEAIRLDDIIKFLQANNIPLSTPHK